MTFSFPFLFAIAYEAKRRQKVHDVMTGDWMNVRVSLFRYHECYDGQARSFFE